jgi:hypothetical protein
MSHLHVVPLFEYDASMAQGRDPTASESANVATLVAASCGFFSGIFPSRLFCCARVCEAPLSGADIHSRACHKSEKVAR